MTYPKLTSRQIVTARDLLGWTQADLAARSGASNETVARIEAGEGEFQNRARAIEALRIALEAAGIDFLDGEKPAVRRTTSISSI